jgi:hypothetical protein
MLTANFGPFSGIGTKSENAQWIVENEGTPTLRIILNSAILGFLHQSLVGDKVSPSLFSVSVLSPIEKFSRDLTMRFMSFMTKKMRGQSCISMQKIVSDFISAEKVYFSRAYSDAVIPLSRINLNKILSASMNTLFPVGTMYYLDGGYALIRSETEMNVVKIAKEVCDA